MFIDLILGLACLILGGVIALFASRMIAGRKLTVARGKAQELIAEANNTQKEILLETKEEALKIKAAAEAEYRGRRSEIQHEERHLAQREESLARRFEAIERREYNLSAKEKEVENVRTRVKELKQKEEKQLELIAVMSSAEAKEVLIQRMEGEIGEEASRRIRGMENRVKEEAEERARQILVLAMQRCATDVVAEATVSVVSLPSDEMKGRLIGREGRNIRALEHATGVELIIDDTPEVVSLSCFDPVRREIARLSLSRLILDGRIHPARIEEEVQKARAEVETTIRHEGEQAAYKVGVQGLHPELIKLLGRLKYRTSYGQNVLMHSIEVALLAGMIAAELGAKVSIAKKAGLLHDIGKGVDFEIDGPHALIGAQLIERWEKSPEVVKAVAEHHSDADAASLEGVIVSTADAISAARPGARSESLEHYLKRLGTLESIANSFPGVEKSYAVYAGREIRVLVKPDEVDDLVAIRLAQNIAQKIEAGLSYPGQIKVTIIRETRAVGYTK